MKAKHIVQEKRQKRVIVWMRRALRVQDNAALFAAMQDADEIIPVLCLKPDEHYKTDSPRRRYIRSSIASLDSELRSLGSRLCVISGSVERELPHFAREIEANAVYAVNVYDTVSLKCDKQIQSLLREKEVEFLTVKDRVIFEKEEILNQAKLPFKVFTPYKRAWLNKVSEIPPMLPLIKSLASPGVTEKKYDISSIEGFEIAGDNLGQRATRKQLRKFIKQKATLYKEQREFPAIDGTSRISAALSLGVISIREVFWTAMEAKKNANKQGRENIDTFISELVWREFYYQILANFPFVTERSFKDDFVGLKWSRNAGHFDAWCEGRTGYPIVDAGMRQLLLEGWMHNRVRMIVASFLTKDLHINWQWGEKFFFEHLCDADIASNNGGWQWSAGTGTDAQPWFRIFNPISQGERFDPNGDYVRKYVPELKNIPSEYIHSPWNMNKQEQIACGIIIGKDYPERVVDHAAEREITIAMYKQSAKAG